MIRYLISAVLALAFCSIPAKAAIAYDSNGSCASSNTTSCTPTSTTVGNIGIVLATRSGSTTAPTCPSGWTCPTGTPWTGSSGSSTTSISWRVGCKKFTLTNDTSGTWTNSGNVVLQSYSGSNVTNAATCDLTIGGKISTAAASATLTFGTITMAVSDGTSWVIGLAGSRTATNVNQAPTGMTNRKASGTTDMVSGNDTNGGVSSWTSKTITVNTTTQEVGIVLELEAPCTAHWCLVNTATITNATCVSAATCTFTVPATTIGHAGVIASFPFLGSANTISSVSGGGTWVHPAGCSAWDGGTVNNDCAYILSFGSSVTSITVTWGTSSSAAIAYYELSYDYASITIDTNAAGTLAACTSCTGQAISLAGLNEAVVNFIGAESACSAVSSPWTFGPNPSSEGSAYQLNVTSVTQPTWTCTSGVAAIGAIALKPVVAANSHMPPMIL